MLLHDFLNKLLQHLCDLFGRPAVLESIDFEELVSLRGVAVLNISNKIVVFTRQLLRPLYHRDSLLELIEKLSDSLMLVNLVDPQFGQSVWNACYDSTTTAYFFYFVLNTRDNFDMYFDAASSENSKLASFIREAQRLEEFFLRFVSDATQNRVAAKINAMIAFLASRDLSSGYQSVGGLVRLTAVRTQWFLVASGDPAEDPRAEEESLRVPRDSRPAALGRAAGLAARPGPRVAAALRGLPCPEPAAEGVLPGLGVQAVEGADDALLEE